MEVDEGTPDRMCEVACQLLFELAIPLNNDHERFRDRLAAIEDVAPLTPARPASESIQQK